MARKTVEDNRTDEQKRRSERNKRYRLKLVASRQAPSHELQTVLRRPEETQKTTLLPTLIAPMLLLCLISMLLTYFQAEVYLNDGMHSWLAWSIAGICELSLLYLSVQMRSKAVARFLFVAMFVYSLGIMSYGIKKVESVRLSETGSHRALVSNVETVRQALDLAVSRKESGNVSQRLKILGDLTSQLDSARNPRVSADALMLDAQSVGFIALRAILMLISAMLVHILGGSISSFGKL